MAAEMVVARMPSASIEVKQISERLTAAGIAHDVRPYVVDLPGHHSHGAAYTMIVVPSGRGSRAMEAFDIANR